MQCFESLHVARGLASCVTARKPAVKRLQLVQRGVVQDMGYQRIKISKGFSRAGVLTLSGVVLELDKLSLGRKLIGQLLSGRDRWQSNRREIRRNPVSPARRSPVDGSLCPGPCWRRFPGRLSGGSGSTAGPAHSSSIDEPRQSTPTLTIQVPCHISGHCRPPASRVNSSRMAVLHPLGRCNPDDTIKTMPLNL